MEKPRGDKVLSDHGARRELAQALAEGVRTHVADLRRRLPASTAGSCRSTSRPSPRWLGAQVPTASGFGRHRTVDPPEASAHLEWVVAAIAEAGAEAWVHSCAPQTPWALVAGTGARGLSADLDMLGPADLDTFAEALEAGRTVASASCRRPIPPTAPSDARLTERVQRWLDMLGLDPEACGEHLVVTPTCGLAGADARVGGAGHAPVATVAAQPLTRRTGRAPWTGRARRAPRGPTRSPRRASAREPVSM